MAASKAEKLAALALSRVVARSMLAGRPVTYEQLMIETLAEVGVLIDKRLKRRGRELRRAWEQSGGIDREFRSLDVSRSGLSPADLPLWHPDHPSSDL